MAWAAVIHKTARNRPADTGRQAGVHRGQALRLGQQVVLGSLPAPSAAQAYADLADARIRECAAAAFGDRALLQKRIVVMAMGALGARQMTAHSPLELVMIHEADPGDDPAVMAVACAEAFEALVATVSGSGRDALYTVLTRPGGAVETVEAFLRRARPGALFGLPQARLVWSTSPALSARLRNALAQTLRRPQDPALCARESAAMRRLQAGRRPSTGPWDCLREPGGLDDIEAFTRRLQVTHGVHGAPLVGPTGQALETLRQETFLAEEAFQVLSKSWTLQHQFAQTLAAALPPGADPEAQHPAIQAVIAASAGHGALAEVKARLVEARQAALRAISKP